MWFYRINYIKDLRSNIYEEFGDNLICKMVILLWVVRRWFGI